MSESDLHFHHLTFMPPTLIVVIASKESES